MHSECPVLPEIPSGNVRQPRKGPRVQMTMVAKQCTVYYHLNTRLLIVPVVVSICLLIWGL